MASTTRAAYEKRYGLMDDEMTPYCPGVNCFTCGRFVGRDGYVGYEHFEMSMRLASIEGECARCIAVAGEPISK